MNLSYIRITRVPYEEPYHLNLLIEASNGRAKGHLEYYCNAESLCVLGNELSSYSGADGQDIVYELGSERVEARFAFYFGLRVGALDSVGHAAITLRMSNNRPIPEKEIVEFCIPAAVSDVNRLGWLLENFGRLEHRVLEWNVEDGRLIEHYE